MIVTFILNILYGFINLIIGFLPVGNLPSGFATALTYLWGVTNFFSYLIPLDTLLQAVIVVLIFDLVLLLWSFVNWVIRKIPGMQ